MNGWLRRFVNPMGSESVPIGMLTSPTEARGERAGLARVAQVAGHADVIAIGNAFDRYLRDRRGTLSLKKALHVAVEARVRALALRGDPPDRHGFGAVAIAAQRHPLDPLAGSVLGIETPGGGRPQTVIAVGVQAAALAVAAFATWLCAPSRRSAPRSWPVGAPAFGNAAYWAPLLRALAESGQGRAGAFAVVAEDGYDVVPGAAIEKLRPAGSPIDRARWRRETAIPAVRLAASVLARVLRNPRDPAVVISGWFALHLARKHLPFQRLLHGARFESYLDISEYGPGHIVKAALLAQGGGRLVRWPHCYLDNPGATLSFLGYHLFLGTGPYEADVYGASWSADCARGTTGFFTNDRRWVSPESQVDAAIAAALADQRRRGRRLLAYFGPSVVSGIGPVIHAGLAAAVDAVTDRPDWALVVKAKGAGADRPIASVLEALPSARALAADGRLIVIPYDVPGRERCPAGWLIREMSAGIGMGSVQLEALTQGKPCFSYLPVVQDTPYQRLLKDCGLGHETPAGLGAMLATWLDRPDALRIPYDRFRAWFDPFADDAALSRIVALLWGQQSARTPDSAAA